jgi:hypothetical protein
LEAIQLAKAASHKEHGGITEDVGS